MYFSALSPFPQLRGRQWIISSTIHLKANCILVVSRAETSVLPRSALGGWGRDGVGKGEDRLRPSIAAAKPPHFEYSGRSSVGPPPATVQPRPGKLLEAAFHGKEIVAFISTLDLRYKRSFPFRPIWSLSPCSHGWGCSL